MHTTGRWPCLLHINNTPWTDSTVNHFAFISRPTDLLLSPSRKKVFPKYDLEDFIPLKDRDTQVHKSQAPHGEIFCL